MTQFDDAVATIIAEIAEQPSTVESVKSLLDGINEQIDNGITGALDAGATPDQLAALIGTNDAIAAQTDKLAAAVAAQEPVPVPAPAPDPTPAPPPADPDDNNEAA